MMKNIFLLPILLLMVSCNISNQSACNVKIGKNQFTLPPDNFTERFFNIGNNSDSEGYNFLYKENDSELIISLIPYGNYSHNSMEERRIYCNSIRYKKGQFKEFLQKNINNKDVKVYSEFDPNIFFLFSRGKGLKQSDYIGICNTHDKISCTYSFEFRDLIVEFDLPKISVERYEYVKNNLYDYLSSRAC